MMPATDTVTNRAFLSELALGADKGTTLWVTAFRGEPNELRGNDWKGWPYSASVQVDDWHDRNAYFSVAALCTDENGEVLRRKTHFSRLLVLCADDIEPEDIIGAVSYIVRTSPGKHQVGIFIDRSDPDAADPALCDRVMQELARLGHVRLDRSGNSITRYVRLPKGQNQKPRESGPFQHELVAWAPAARMSLADACAALGVDLDSLRQVEQKTSTDRQHTNHQSQKLRETITDLLRGENWHDGIAVTAASLIASGTHPGAVVNLLRGILEAIPGQHDSRWQMRYADIPRAVDTAAQKFTREKTHEETADAAAAGRYRIFPAGEFLAGIRATHWLIEGLIPRGQVYSLTGPTGHGKTAVAATAQLCLALGVPFCGRRVEAGRVLVLAGENPDDYGMRLFATINAMGIDRKKLGNLGIIKNSFKLGDSLAFIEDEITRFGDVASVWIDTTAAFFGGDDDNDNVAMLEHAKHMRRLAELPGGPAVISLSHPIKSFDKTNLLPRGGGAFLNEIDGNLTCVRDDQIVTLHWAGKRRGQDFDPIAFELKQVTLAGMFDQYGNAVVSVAATPTEAEQAEQMRKDSFSRDNAVLMAISRNGTRRASVEDLRVSAGLSSKSRVQSALESLEKQGLVKRNRAGRWELLPAGTKACADLSAGSL